MLWVEVLLLVNEVFCVMALLESCYAVKVAFEGTGTVEEERSEFVDYWAKRVVPSLYVLCLAITYSITMDDGYSATTNEMWQGLVSGHGAKMTIDWMRIVLPFLALVVVIVSYKGAQRSKHLKRFLPAPGGASRKHHVVPRA
eukprot:4116459-Prymnesium_polylepis.1